MGESAGAPLKKLFLPVVLVVSDLETHGWKKADAPAAEKNIKKCLHRKPPYDIIHLVFHPSRGRGAIG